MTNSNSPPYKVGDRIECCKFFGTIRYIGPVEGKPATWLGIEWDIPERGKHDGTVDGKQYFSTNHPTGGSFVRPEKVDFGKSALSSIVARYGQSEDEFTAKINQQKQLRLQQSMNAPFLEMVGFEKVFNKQSNLDSLRIVCLREQNINCAGSSTELGITCPSIEELDLSKNLMSSWRDVFEICDQLPNLHWLNVGENLLQMPESYVNYKYPNIRTLICGSMKIDWDQVLKILTCFPGVEEFRAPLNNITILQPLENENLKILDIEGNFIQDWSEVCKLGESPNLEQLIVENIGLKLIRFEPPGTSKVTIFPCLRKLCIVDNLIEDWESIGELNRLPRLENLKLLKNPVLEKENLATNLQMIMARIETLTILNGGQIDPTERRGSEIDYLKKFGLEWLKVKGTDQQEEFLKTHTRYYDLIQKYGEPEEAELVEKSKDIKSSLIVVKLIYGLTVVEKKLPPTITVQKLQMLVQKLFLLEDRPQLTYRSSAHSHIEIDLIDEMKEIEAYSMQDGDEIMISDAK